MESTLTPWRAGLAPMVEKIRLMTLLEVAECTAAQNDYLI